MKLLDRVFEKALETSTKFLDLKKDIVELANNVNALAKSVVGVAQAVQQHHVAISELYAIQAQILKVVKRDSVDTRLPDDKKKEAAKKPN